MRRKEKTKRGVEEPPKEEPMENEAGAGLPMNITHDSVYDFYYENLIPAIKASLPFLLYRLRSDIVALLRLAGGKFANFLVPRLSDGWQNRNFLQLLEQSNSTITEFMIRHFDTNQDGAISTSELLNMTEIISSIHSPHPQSFIQWFSLSWPLMDWQVGVFLWRSCGGLLFIIAFASLLPGRLHGFLGKILRWPVLGLTYFLVAVELVVYIVIRIFIRIIETVFATSKHRALRRRMRLAKSYDEWHRHAKILDVSQGRERWRRTVSDESSYRYNWSYIRSLIRDMRNARKKGDSLQALAILQQCTKKNVGGIMSEESFSFTNTGEPKYIITEFVDELVETLKWVTDESLSTPVENAPVLSTAEQRAYEDKLQRKVEKERMKLWGSVVSWATLSFKNPERSSRELDSFRRGVQGMRSKQDTSPIPVRVPLPAYHREKVRMFLKRARALHGRTALVLSGGAMMGCYHFGHIKALHEVGCLPTIISGTSAGSVIGAIVCTRTDEEIRRDMSPEVLAERLTCFALPWKERLKNLRTKGCMFNYEDWRELIRWMTCGDMTFEEAYKKTGRTFCITLSTKTKKSPPVLLNHISAPNVVISSAVIASAAVPGFIQPTRLETKDASGKISYQGDSTELYWDGSIEQDIPTTGLAEMLNCQFFIAAQCNPHIVPFFYNCKGGVGRPSRWSSGDREDAWRGGFLLSALELYLKSDMKAKFQFLDDIEAAVGFTSKLMTQQFVGSTTIVPQVSFIDYFKLFSDPTKSDLYRYEQAGCIAAYEHCGMIKLHYKVADALEECLDRLDKERDSAKPKVVVDGLPNREKARAIAHARSLKNNSLHSETNSDTTGTRTDDEAEDDGFHEIESFLPAPPASRRQLITH